MNMSDNQEAVQETTAEENGQVAAENAPAGETVAGEEQVEEVTQPAENAEVAEAADVPVAVSEEVEVVVAASADDPLPQAGEPTDSESLSTIENLQSRVDELDLNESASSESANLPTTTNADDTSTSNSLSPSNCDLNTSASPSESPESQSLSSPTINANGDTNGYQSLQPAQQQPSPSSTYSSRPSIFNGRSLDPELSELLTRKHPKVVPAAPKCSKCDKSVYKAEEIRAAGKTFHKLCFKCTACNKLLEPNIITEHAGDLYCRNCYGKKFGPKGYGYGQGAGTLSTDPGSASLAHISPTAVVNHQKSGPTLKSTFSTLSQTATNQTGSSPPQPMFKPVERRNSPGTVTNFTFGGSDKCARCLKAVYAAEKVMASGKPYHKLCFACSTCKKLLNSMNCCNNSENEVFCKACYGKQYGPKGVGYGVGAGTLQTN